MKAYLTRRYMFSASHRLHSDAMSDVENSAIYGKCNNPYGHGHNYTLEVMVSGAVNEKTGMVCNLVDLDEFVRGQILTKKRGWFAIWWIWMSLCAAKFSNASIIKI